jgi:hypothetical protein
VSRRGTQRDRFRAGSVGNLRRLPLLWKALIERLVGRRRIIASDFNQ